MITKTIKEWGGAVTLEKGAGEEQVEAADTMNGELDLVRGGGDLWTADDRPDDIARIMIMKLSRNKAENVARCIVKQLKEQQVEAAS